jgi:uncharacterized Zn-finger protein
MASEPNAPEIAYVTSSRVACDGLAAHPALGHPRVFLQIDEKGFVECGYCDKRFILKGGLADDGIDERVDPGAGENSGGSLPSATEA